MMIELIKGEKRLIPMVVTRRRKKEEFEIESVNCEVYDRDNNLLETGKGEINESYKEIYYLLDTTRDDYVIGKNYTVVFTVKIISLPKIIKGERIVKIRR